MRNVTAYIDKHLYELAFVITAAGTLGSLILSNVLGLYPCQLCWYQRIAMFPLPLIYLAGLMRRDLYAYLYAWPLAIVGAVIAGYQSLLQWGVITEGDGGCTIGGSCAEPEINILGFLTIPFGAFLIFLATNYLMWRAYKLHHNPRILDKLSSERAMKLLLGVALLSVLAIAIIEALNITV